MSESQLTELEAVQRLIGSPAGARDLKVLDHLDSHARRWLGFSTVAFMAFSHHGRPAITAAGGAPGFLADEGDQALSVPLDMLDYRQFAQVGSPFGALCLVPGMGETLRVNGRIHAIENNRLLLQVDECFLHCAKALLRAEYWQFHSEETPPLAKPAPLAVDRCRLLALATSSADGQMDISPKGDPAGALLTFDGEGDLSYPDRPGNRRIDSLRNILEQPEVALLALAPGTTSLIGVIGQARITHHEALQRAFAVQGKVPKLITRVRVTKMEHRESPALARARPWVTREAPPELDAAEIFRDHVRRSRERGLSASLGRAMVGVPGLMRHGLASDYKKNMY
ncbi:MAG: pyridoxamine 5'-phosphate oxidase family protein [Pseudomonadota bacterium]